MSLSFSLPHASRLPRASSFLDVPQGEADGAVGVEEAVLAVAPLHQVFADDGGGLFGGDVALHSLVGVDGMGGGGEAVFLQPPYLFLVQPRGEADGFGAHTELLHVAGRFGQPLCLSFFHAFGQPLCFSLCLSFLLCRVDDVLQVAVDLEAVFVVVHGWFLSVLEGYLAFLCAGAAAVGVVVLVDAAVPLGFPQQAVEGLAAVVVQAAFVAELARVLEPVDEPALLVAVLGRAAVVGVEEVHVALPHVLPALFFPCPSFCHGGCVACPFAPQSLRKMSRV